MTAIARIMCGVILITVPTIEYGGYFLLTLLTGKEKMPLTDFQRSMFRAGHAHAGVLVILSLVLMPMIDETQLNPGLQWFLRIGFPLAAILVSAGFFAGAAGANRTSPNNAISILYVGALLLAVSLVMLGVSLIRR